MIGINRSYSLILLAILGTILTSCSKGPSETQVLKDWEDFSKSAQKQCLKDVNFNKVEIIATSKTDKMAEVIIKITGDWKGGRLDPGYFSQSPCKGFHARAAKTQVVKRKFTYKKYDSGWILESNDIKK